MLFKTPCIIDICNTLYLVVNITTNNSSLIYMCNIHGFLTQIIIFSLQLYKVEITPTLQMNNWAPD